MKKRALAVFLCISILLPALAACSVDAENGGVEYKSDEEQTTKENNNEGKTTDNSSADDPDDNENKTTGGSGNINVSTEELTTFAEWNGEEVLNYTYKLGTTALGTNWNPHTWSSDADKVILDYISSPLVDVSVKDSVNGVYQWVYEMAVSVTDVTAWNQTDLDRYGADLPAGVASSDVTEGYVYEIKLNPNAAWENGVSIKADDYIYSMQMLLHPNLRNIRAESYYSGEFSIAGGEDYYFQDSILWVDAKGAYAISDMIKSEDGTHVASDGTPLAIAPLAALDWLGGNSLADYINAYGDDIFDVASFEALVAKCNDKGYAPVTDETLELLINIITFSDSWGEKAEDARNYFVCGKSYPKASYDDTVGCYKVDDHTIRYVCENYVELNRFLYHLRSNWLVYKPLYYDCLNRDSDVWTTDYGTSSATTMSYGVYRMEAFNPNRQAVFAHNESWYGFERKSDGSLLRDETGNLVSFTNFKVDGKYVRQYMTTRIQIDVMTEDAMKNAFLKGELSEWAPSADEISRFAMSDRLIKADEAYNLAFFFNIDLYVLENLDSKEINTNSIVLSNYSFRKAMSLAINRASLAMRTQGFEPSFTIMNSLYHYDLYNDPESSYRNSEAAMRAICELYGVEYGDGSPYATLKMAYDSITGYNFAEARSLMKQACDELVTAGLYSKGENIKIQIAWADGELTADDNKQVELLNQMINNAAEGSGFGTITFEAVGNIQNRYSDVIVGEYGIGYGAWGGDALDPFGQMKIHCDMFDMEQISGVSYFNPNITNLTINVGGEDVTMTWSSWVRACSTGEYADKDFATKLHITATMEKEFLKLYYYIPLYSFASSYLISYQIEQYTSDYNIMYGFGGLRLISFNYDDAAWAESLVQEGGCLYYEW